jgi:hypothetical protein
MRATPATAAWLVIATLATAPATASGSVSIHEYSQAMPEGRAQAGGSITVSGHRGGGSGPPSSYGGRENVAAGSSGSQGPELRVVNYPTEPRGPGSYWYFNEKLHECIALAGGQSECLEEGGAAQAPARPGRPAINPEAIAVTVSDRLNLEVGKIAASPSAHVNGLTGAASWFWLEPPPAARSLSLSLRGEQVTVSATAKAVQWSFGDGSQLVGDAGVAYRPGPAPAGAVRHVYETRCLPGDRGHDPNVSSGCGAQGYQVQAGVEWAISYQASGLVTTSGSLPSRATSTSIAYPVSEVRAFLTRSGGGQ